MSRLLVALPLLMASHALGGCATAAPEAPEIPGCYDGPCIAIGEMQSFGILHVTPLDVLEDSRCPIEADCVWEGELRITAKLDIGHETFETELVAYQPFTINGGTLLLAEVAPDASVRWPELAPAEYRFRFIFED